MSGWAIVAIIGILVWGVTQWNRAKHGIVTDEYGNESRAMSDDPETRREIEELRARCKAETGLEPPQAPVLREHIIKALRERDERARRASAAAE